MMPLSRLGCPVSLKTPNMGNTGLNCFIRVTFEQIDFRSNKVLLSIVGIKANSLAEKLNRLIEILNRTVRPLPTLIGLPSTYISGRVGGIEVYGLREVRNRLFKYGIISVQPTSVDVLGREGSSSLHVGVDVGRVYSDVLAQCLNSLCEQRLAAGGVLLGPAPVLLKGGGQGLQRQGSSSGCRR